MEIFGALGPIYFDHQNVANRLRLPSPERTSFHRKTEAEGDLEVPLRTSRSLAEAGKEVHPVMAGNSMALVRFDSVDLVFRLFLDHAAFDINGLVLDGPWLSQAHGEMKGGTNNALMLQKLKVWMISTSLTMSISFREKFARPVPISQHRLKTFPQ